MPDCPHHDQKHGVDEKTGARTRVCGDCGADLGPVNVEPASAAPWYKPPAPALEEPPAPAPAASSPRRRSRSKR